VSLERDEESLTGDDVGRIRMGRSHVHPEPSVRPRAARQRVSRNRVEGDAEVGVGVEVEVGVEVGVKVGVKVGV